ncbi:MAG: MmgE/PrpD family protein [Betaproteobacteria bacterium]|nr:MmgE/PrpD family protein [Betaproteobacteria bacterium]
MTVSQTLARFVARTSFESIGDANVAAAKVAISDTIGCIIAGAATDAGTIVRRVAEASSPDGAATVIGGLRALSAQAAALANGTAAHALDYDDILWTEQGHPSAAMLPSSLAVAETLGASGRDLLTAYAIGVEVAGKLGRAVNPAHYESGWHATASVGVIGAAAAAARLMHLTEHQTAMALGIAASHACGVRRNFGTMTKPFHAGNAARGGVMAAELAREGFTADLTAFEGVFGWAVTMHGRTIPQAEVLEAALGKVWELSEPGIVLKRYPACGGTHCALDAILAIRDEQNLKADEFEKIVCDASPLAKMVLLYSRPKTGLEGKFSMEFNLAIAALEGEAGLRHFTDAWVADPRVQDMLHRITFETRSDMAPECLSDAVPAEVTVHARGKIFARRVDVPRGDARNPMSSQERRTKFLGCAEGLLADDAAGALFHDLERLDSLKIADLTALLRPLAATRAHADASQPQ